MGSQSNIGFATNENTTIYDYFGPNPMEASIKKKRRKQSSNTKKNSHSRKSSLSSHTVDKVASMLEQSITP